MIHCGEARVTLATYLPSRVPFIGENESHDDPSLSPMDDEDEQDDRTARRGRAPSFSPDRAPARS
eukprot:25152-Pyramimonas_sp.AAC.1